MLPAFRALAETVPYLLASIDRTGADITVVDALGASVDTVEVQGSHDVVHKVAGGQMSGRRIQARAEDSWERNAAEVARELEELISRHHPAVVLLDGDAVAVSHLLDAAGGRLKELAVRLKYGGRGSGASTKSRDAEIAGVLVGQRRAANAALMDRFGTEEGRQEAAVQGLESVVDAARRAQIGELLLHDDPRPRTPSGSAPAQANWAPPRRRCARSVRPMPSRCGRTPPWCGPCSARMRA